MIDSRPNGNPAMMLVIMLVDGGDIAAVALVALAIATAGTIAWLIWRWLRDQK